VMAPQHRDCIGQLIVYRDYWRIDPFFCQKGGNLSRHNTRSHDGDYPVIKLKCLFESILLIKDEVSPNCRFDFFGPTTVSIEANDSNIQVFGEYRCDLLSPSGLSCSPISIIADFAIPASRTLRAMSETVPLIITWSSQDA